MAESFQLSSDAAELYESAFVPAFFAQWAPLLCDAAGIGPGQRALDVACGTGIVARTAAERGATAAGVDLNDAMLTVARRVRPDLDFRQGNADALPFADGSFDSVLCQMALMFFPDRSQALAEMARVAITEGTVAVAVPGALDTQAAFAPFVAMAARHAGPEALSLLSTYFACGSLDDLAALASSAGLDVASAATHLGTYRAPSIDAFVTTEVESTPLADRLSDDVYRQIRSDAHDVLTPFTTPDGRVEAPFECNIVVGHPVRDRSS